MELGGGETFGVADEPLALDTPIPTPSGWTTMAKLKVGDKVFGSDGQPSWSGGSPGQE